MFWKIVIIILCLLWWLPILYMWRSMKKIKRVENYLDDEIDDYESMVRLYRRDTKENIKEIERLNKMIDNQRQITNGWEHKIRILDEEIRKLKKELSKSKE